MEEDDEEIILPILSQRLRSKREKTESLHKPLSSAITTSISTKKRTTTKENESKEKSSSSKRKAAAIEEDDEEVISLMLSQKLRSKCNKPESSHKPLPSAIIHDLIPNYASTSQTTSNKQTKFKRLKKNNINETKIAEKTKEINKKSYSKDKSMNQHRLIKVLLPNVLVHPKIIN